MSDSIESFAFMAAVCSSAADAMDANGLADRTYRLREISDRLRALSSPAVVEYDRPLIADMLSDLVYDDGYGMKSHGQYTVESIKEQRDLLLAADEADAAGVHTGRATPAGDWVLVPRAPSDEMVWAGRNALTDASKAMTRKDNPEARAPMTEAYEAMLAVAPQPQVVDGCGACWDGCIARGSCRLADE